MTEQINERQNKQMNEQGTICDEESLVGFDRLKKYGMSQ